MILESNAREIESVNLWVSGVQKTADVITMDNYVGYDFRGTPGQIYYTLNEYSEKTEEDGSVRSILTPLVDGKIFLTTEVADSWGQDDQVIFDFVTSQLNITLV